MRLRTGWLRMASALVVVALPLSACTTGTVDSATSELDQSSLTGSLAAAQPADPTRSSDEAIIRNAVSAADPEQAQIQPLAWANADTGSRGAIMNLVERKQDGKLCRQFTASREAFDGVALFSGDACKGDRGNWYMRIFKQL